MITSLGDRLVSDPGKISAAVVAIARDVNLSMRMTFQTIRVVVPSGTLFVSYKLVLPEVPGAAGIGVIRIMKRGRTGR